MEKKSNNVIAMRELHFENDLNSKIKVEVFQPYLSKDGIFRCEFNIEGAPEELQNLYAGGADSYQAICLALRTLSSIVDIFNKEYCDSKLRWMGEKDLDFHFSTYINSDKE